MLESYLKWFMAHERILALLIIMAVIGFAGNKYLNLEATKADARNQAAQADARSPERSQRSN